MLSMTILCYYEPKNTGYTITQTRRGSPVFSTQVWMYIKVIIFQTTGSLMCQDMTPFSSLICVVILFKARNLNYLRQT